MSSPAPEPQAQTGFILFCGNDAYTPHMAACIASLLDNSSLSHHHIAIAGDFRDMNVERRLRRLLSQYENLSFEIIAFTPPIKDLPTRQHWTVDMFTRFWVDEFFPDDVDRVLYLDADMIIKGDIAELWQSDLAGKLFGAVTIPGSDQCARCGVPERFGYFNSGVLLIDMDLWRKRQPREQLLSYTLKNTDSILYPDQDALNACLYEDRHPLGFEWNVIAPFSWPKGVSTLSESQRKQVLKDARIVHFNGRSKPWHFINSHPYKRDYWHYLKQTPWHAEQPVGVGLASLLKKIANAILPRRITLWVWRLRHNEPG